MEIDFLPRDERHPLRLKFEILLNTLNHVFIGFITINMTWLCFENKWTVDTLHAWLCTIGYNLLLAESILCFHAANVWTDVYSVRAKTGVHWFLHMTGAGMGLAGVILKLVYENGRFHSTPHAIFGFIASFLLVFNFFTSTGAFFHHIRGKKIHPFTHSAIQNFIYSAFITGMLLVSSSAVTLILTVAEYVVLYLKQCHTPVEDIKI